jgi:hypothetical protein
MTRPRPVVTVAVEGTTDVPVVERILGAARLQMGPVHVAAGKDRLDARLTAYNYAARHHRWLVLRDLDRDAACAPDLVTARLPTRSTYLCFRIAVRATEAWLIADRERLARFLGVPERTVSEHPEDLDDPRRALIALAQRSRHRAVREDMVPAHGTSAQVGPGYTSRIIEFAKGAWRPSVAARSSPSLAGCIRCLQRLR